MLFLSFQTGWADFLLTSDARRVWNDFFCFYASQICFYFSVIKREQTFGSFVLKNIYL